MWNFIVSCLMWVELWSGWKGVVFPSSSSSSSSSSSPSLCSKRRSVSSKSAIWNKTSIIFMEVGEKNNPNFEKKTSNALKADRAIQKVTFHPNILSPSEVLRVPVPKLGDEVVLVPGSFSPIFDSAVSGHANNVYCEQRHKSSCWQVDCEIRRRNRRTLMVRIYSSSVKSSS